MTYILILATILRLINLNQSLWLDEAFQFKAANFFNLKDMLTVYLPGDFNPPLLYIIHWFLGRLAGWSEIVLRLPSVIFGVATVWLVYRLGGKWPALLLATSGLHVYYSQEARMYSLAAFLVTASFYCLKSEKWAGYILASLGAIYSHYLTGFIFPAQLLLVKKKSLPKLLSSWLAVAVGFIPWLPIFIQQLQAGSRAAGTVWGNVIGGLNLKNILLIPVKFLVGRISVENNLVFASLILVPLVIVFWSLWRGMKKNKLAVVWLIVPTLLIMITSVFVPVLAYFRLLFVLPAVYLLARPTKTVFVGWLIFNLITTGIYLFNLKFHREDWRAAARAIGNQPVVVFPAVDAPLKYYGVTDLRGTELIPENEFYYVAYAEDIFDPGREFRQRAEAGGFRDSGQVNFRGNISLIKYTQ